MFFLEVRSNSKITLIKTNGVVIYHADNNGGNSHGGQTFLYKEFMGRLF